MLNNVMPTDNKVVVKIFDADKVLKTTSAGGIITTHPMKQTMDSCQIGIAIAGGKNIKTYIKEGEMILFNWGVESDDESFLGRDETGEYRYVTEKQIFGTIKHNKKSGYDHIQPKKHYVVCEPNNKDFELTRSMFQIPVSAVNPLDDVAQAIGVKAGDWIVCLPFSAVPITVNRKVFFFIFLEDIVYINDGQQRISINRKKVYKDLRLASRNIKTELN